MAITIMDMNGPPEARQAAVFRCDICLDPILGPNAGIAVWWATGHGPDGRPNVSEVFTVHKGRCDRALLQANEGRQGGDLTQELEQIAEQLAFYTGREFEPEERVEYVLPAPSNWRAGSR